MEEREWQLQDAKNKFSELVDRAVEGEAQVVTRRGKRTAVLVSAEEYARLKGHSAKGPADFVQHLLAAPKGDFRAPKRTKTKLRKLDLG
jgi:prevent-host-death family protein